MSSLLFGVSYLSLFLYDRPSANHPPILCPVAAPPSPCRYLTSSDCFQILPRDCVLSAEVIITPKLPPLPGRCAVLAALPSPSPSQSPSPSSSLSPCFSRNFCSHKDFNHWAITSWPSGHAATAMAGLLFLAYVLWRDLAALVMVRTTHAPNPYSIQMSNVARSKGFPSSDWLNIR